MTKIWKISLMLIATTIFFTACNKDSDVDLSDTNTPVETTNGATTPNPGNDSSFYSFNSSSSDDDYDGDCDDLCFDLVYPVTIVFPDGTTADANDDDGLEDLLDAWFEQNPDVEDDFPTFSYPIQVEVEDEMVTIESDEDFEELLEYCYDEYDEDDEEDDCDDEECEEYELSDCFEIVFPITLTLPDGSELTINNEDELYEAFEMWDDDEEEEFPELNYPIELILEEDDTQVTVNDEEELEAILEECFDDWGKQSKGKLFKLRKRR